MIYKRQRKFTKNQPNSQSPQEEKCRIKAKLALLQTAFYKSITPQRVLNVSSLLLMSKKNGTMEDEKYILIMLPSRQNRKEYTTSQI